MVFNDFYEFSVSEELFSVTLTVYILSSTCRLNIMHTTYPWDIDDLNILYNANMFSSSLFEHI